MHLHKLQLTPFFFSQSTSQFQVFCVLGPYSDRRQTYYSIFLTDKNDPGGAVSESLYSTTMGEIEFSSKTIVHFELLCVKRISVLKLFFSCIICLATSFKYFSPPFKSNKFAAVQTFFKMIE